MHLQLIILSATCFIIDYTNSIVRSELYIANIICEIIYVQTATFTNPTTHFNNNKSTTNELLQSFHNIRDHLNQTTQAFRFRSNEITSVMQQPLTAPNFTELHRLVSKQLGVHNSRKYTSVQFPPIVANCRRTSNHVLKYHKEVVIKSTATFFDVLRTQIKRDESDMRFRKDRCIRKVNASSNNSILRVSSSASSSSIQTRLSRQMLINHQVDDDHQVSERVWCNYERTMRWRGRV